MAASSAREEDAELRDRERGAATAETWVAATSATAILRGAHEAWICAEAAARVNARGAE